MVYTYSEVQCFTKPSVTTGLFYYIFRHICAIIININDKVAALVILEINMYKPNFNDPRVQKRARKALQFATTALDKNIPHSWSTRYIDRYFGQIQLPLSKWLRSQLLICTDNHWSYETGKCKKYIRNNVGVDYIKHCLNFKGLDLDFECFKDEVKTGNFKYEEQSYREWHPLQRVPSTIRKPYLATHGYIYEYDLKTCAPNLLLQYARRLGLETPTPQIDLYIKDRTAIRNLIAEQLDIDPKTIKKIITALFAGAPLSHYPDTEIYRLLNRNHLHIDVLKQVLADLRKEIKLLWDTIKQYTERTYITTSKGTQRLKPLTGRDKWNIYFQLEKLVMDSVRTYLKKTKNKFFNEHDGWRCQEIVDEIMLRTYVRNQTGYVIELDMNICSL